MFEIINNLNTLSWVLHSIYMYQDNTVSHKYVQLYKFFFSLRKRKIKHPELAFYLRIQAS